MHISLRREADRWAIGWAPLAAMALYLLLAAFAHFTVDGSPVALSACRFKLITGIPCPTCGATRAAFALLAGRLADAWRFNPLVTCTYTAALPWLALRYFGRRRLAVQFSRAGRWIAAGVFAVLVGANWAYVIVAAR